MKELVTLYIGTYFLAVLSQHYNPGDLSNRYRVSRHFFRDQVDIFALIIIIWATLFSGLRLSYNDTLHYIAYFENAATTLSEHFATSSETGFTDNPLYYILEVLVRDTL